MKSSVSTPYSSSSSNLSAISNTLRRKNPYESERDKFVQSQTASIQKAVNQQECALKEKHVRIVILGTHQEGNADLFWSVVRQLPLQGNYIVAWKFCGTLHKLLRDGHPNAIADSLRQADHITEMGRMWGHLKHGYGPLLASYCTLLVCKLRFHEHNKQIPANLVLSQEERDSIGGKDINQIFQVTCEMFDYMDDVLALQQQVFNSLDKSRANSMTASGQCRLAPLIMCIQEASLLYDYIVGIMFKMHKCLPPETLEGHRLRFRHIFTGLKQFYNSSTNLQYFKNLVQVPSLPEEPPNFLVESSFDTYRAPVVVLPQEPILDEVDSASLLDIGSDNNDSLVDSAELQQKERLIGDLMNQVDLLRQQLETLRFQSERMIESLRARVRELEAEVDQWRHKSEQVELRWRAEVEQLRKRSAEEQALQQAQALAVGNEDKFKKMKDLYAKLRQEHIDLIRKSADTAKELSSVKQKHAHLDAERETLKAQLDAASKQKALIEQTLKEASNERVHEVVQVNQAKIQLEGDLQMLRSQLSRQQTEADELRQSWHASFEEVAQLQARLQDQGVLLTGAEERCSSLEVQVASLREETQLLATERNRLEKKAQDDVQQEHDRLFALQCSVCVRVLTQAQSDVDHPSLLSCRAGAEALLLVSDPVVRLLRDTDWKDTRALFGALPTLVHHGAEMMFLARAAAKNAPEPQQAEELVSASDRVANLLLSVTSVLPSDGVAAAECLAAVEHLRQLASTLLPKVADISREEIGDLVEEEMQRTADAIEAATQRIQQMIDKTRSEQSGIRLQVSEKILDTCQGLMDAVKMLIGRSKELQKEIAQQGRGTASSKEFYSKNHRWTEGLISAAKQVGLAARMLIDKADLLVAGEGQFEAIIACSQEIAASTAQLVVASKVKADRNSTRLGEVTEASRAVTMRTAQLVAEAKSGSRVVEEAVLDFSQLSLTQTKRVEMEAQVKVLELEKLLERERERLGTLRKQHYQLAGADEGWGDEVEQK